MTSQWAERRRAGRGFRERPILRMLRLRAVGRRRDTRPGRPGHVAGCVRGANLVILMHQLLDPKAFVSGAQIAASRCLRHPSEAMRPQGEAIATGILGTRDGLAQPGEFAASAIGLPR